MTLSPVKSSGNFNHHFKNIRYQISSSIFDQTDSDCVNELLLGQQNSKTGHLTLSSKCFKIGEGRISLQVENIYGVKSIWHEEAWNITNEETISLTEVSKKIHEIDIFENNYVYSLMAIPSSGNCGVNGTWIYHWTQVCFELIF